MGFNSAFKGLILAPQFWNILCSRWPPRHSPFAATLHSSPVPVTATKHQLLPLPSSCHQTTAPPQRQGHHLSWCFLFRCDSALFLWGTPQRGDHRRTWVPLQYLQLRSIR